MLAMIKIWLEQMTLVRLLDWGGAAVLMGLALYLTRKSRAVILVRGFVVLVVMYLLTQPLTLIHFLIEKVVLAAAIAMGILFQPEFRSLLEQLGRGRILGILLGRYDELTQALTDPNDTEATGYDYLEELVQATRELSQNRTGALIVIESEQAIDPRIFTDKGVLLNARLTRELLQTIFQTSTLLHDGAVVTYDSRIKAAGVILPVSERVASRQLGTRHRAAMGISEQTNCLCIVVSEETGSISLAEGGRLERPLTSSKLKDLLTQRLRHQRVAPADSALQQLRPERMLGLARRLLTSPLEKTLPKE